MPAVRRLLARRGPSLMLCALALLVKLLVPAGYMLGSDRDGRTTIELCSGAASHPMTMAMPGRGGHGDHGDHGRAEMPCAFAGLAAASLGAIDEILIAAFVAFIVATGLAPAMRAAPSPRVRIRPPLRGPPPAF